MILAPFFRLLDMGRTVGMPRALWSVPSWALRRDFVVLVRDLREALPEPQQIPNVRWTVLGHLDLARVRTLDPGIPEAAIDAWYGEGQQCVLGWFGDVLAYMHWDSTTPAYLWYLRKTLHLRDGESYAGHSFTAPAFRNRGLNRAGHLVALQRLRGNGCTRSISIIARWNAPSLAVADRLSRQPVGTVGYWNVGAVRRYHTSGRVRLGGQNEIYVER